MMTVPFLNVYGRASSENWILRTLDGKQSRMAREEAPWGPWEHGKAGQHRWPSKGDLLELAHRFLNVFVHGRFPP